jgi:hypothetical protein
MASKGGPRRFHFWSLVLWMGPGAVASWLLRDSVPWVSFMSWYAIVVTHLGGWGSGRAEDAASSD